MRKTLNLILIPIMATTLANSVLAAQFDPQEATTADPGLRTAHRAPGVPVGATRRPSARYNPAGS